MNKWAAAATATQVFPCAIAARYGKAIHQSQHRAISTALYGRKVKGPFHAHQRKRKGITMPPSKPPTQVQYRNSKTGEFTTRRYAERHPATTERERVKHPERK